MSETTLLEEYKLVLERNHYWMTRFFHAFALWLGVIGLSVTVIPGATPPTIIMFLVFSGMLTGIGLWMTFLFRGMIHGLADRQGTLAEKLDFEHKPNLHWGYGGVAAMATTVYIGLLIFGIAEMMRSPLM